MKITADRCVEPGLHMEGSSIYLAAEGTLVLTSVPDHVAAGAFTAFDGTGWVHRVWVPR